MTTLHLDAVAVAEALQAATAAANVLADSRGRLTGARVEFYATAESTIPFVLVWDSSTDHWLLEVITS
jgi:methylthioribose-1-phosphate isomerase